VGLKGRIQSPNQNSQRIGEISLSSTAPRGSRLNRPAPGAAEPQPEASPPHILYMPHHPPLPLAFEQGIDPPPHPLRIVSSSRH